MFFSKFLIYTLLLTNSLFITTALAHNNDEKSTKYDDGPYLFYNNNHIQQFDVINSKLEITNYAGPLAIPEEFKATDKDQYSDVKKFAAISDIHGQFAIFKKLLINNGVINDALNWQYGTGHLIITGDIFDRGDTVTEALWLVFKLEQQAAIAGGHVHYLLGNHEYLVLRNDQRYLHPKYKHTVSFFNDNLTEQYSVQSVLGRWLRSKSTIIKLNDFIFLHGGIHEDFLNLNMTLESANQAFRDSISKSKKELKANPLWATLHGKTGPIWYRGYFRDEQLKDEAVAGVLRKLQASKVIVGHTSMPSIEMRFDGKVIAIDSSIKRGKEGELLLWENNQFFRATLTGEKKPL